MELKPLALIVLLKAIASPNEPRSYHTLGQSLGISGSQAHAAVRQALRAGLATERERGQWQPIRPALFEFIVHGVQYVWPATFGPQQAGYTYSLWRGAPVQLIIRTGRRSARVGSPKRNSERPNALTTSCLCATSRPGRPSPAPAFGLSGRSKNRPRQGAHARSQIPRVIHL